MTNSLTIVAYSPDQQLVQLAVIEPTSPKVWDQLTEDRVCSGFFPTGSRYVAAGKNLLGVAHETSSFQYEQMASGLSFEMDLTDSPQSCTIGIVQ